MDKIIISDNCSFIKKFYDIKLDDDTNKNLIICALEKYILSKQPNYGTYGETKTFPGLLCTKNIIHKNTKQTFEIITSEHNDMFITKISSLNEIGEISIVRKTYCEASKDHIRLIDAMNSFL